MNNRLTLVLEGAVTALTDLSTTLPNASKAKGQPAPVPRQYIIKDGVQTEVLYMNSGGFRGRLRKAIFDLVRNKITEKNNGVSLLQLEDHLFNALGGIKSEGAEKFQPDLQMKIRNANPLVSLFGASTPWLKGCAQVSHLVSDLSPEFVNKHGGVRSKVDVESLKFLEKSESDKYIREIALTTKRSTLKKKKDVLEKEIKAKGGGRKDDYVAFKPAELKEKQAELEGVAADIAAINEEASSTVSILMPLEGYEAIPTGTQLSSSISLTNASPLEIGLFILGLQHYAITEGTIGGHLSNGLGKIGANYSVRIIDDLNVEVLPDQLTFECQRSFRAPDVLQKYTDIAQKWLDNIDYNDLKAVV